MTDPNEQQARGTWKQFTGRIRESWGALTGDELEKYEGKRQQLEGFIEKKTGESREKIRKRLDQIVKETDYSF